MKYVQVCQKNGRIFYTLTIGKKIKDSDKYQFLTIIITKLEFDYLLNGGFRQKEFKNFDLKEN